MGMTMKKLLFLIAALALTVPAMNAEMKVVERSAKKAPSWLGTAHEGYIVAMGEAPTLAEARRLAEQDIAAQMVLSVARNISTSSTNVSSETVTNGAVESSDSYSGVTAIRGANLPFLKGISLSKAEDVYWVKSRDKKKGTERVEYYVKYPFFRVEQQQLIAEFDDYDSDKANELQALEDGLDTVDSPDGIANAVASLNALGAYFFDEVRAAKVKSLVARYKALGKSIVMTGRFTGRRALTVAFELNGHVFRMSAPLKATSNCASDIQVRPADGAYRITFSTDDCLDDEENYIEVTLRAEGRKFDGKYIIKEL